MRYINVKDVHYPPGNFHNSLWFQGLPSHTHPEMFQARIDYRCRAYKVAHTKHKYCLSIVVHIIQETQIPQLLDNRLCFSDHRNWPYLIEVYTLPLKIMSNGQNIFTSNLSNIKRIYRKEIDLMNLPKALALHSRVQRRTPGCCVEQQKRLIHQKFVQYLIMSIHNIYQISIKNPFYLKRRPGSERLS